MYDNENNLLELPKKGKVIIITDLHGNLKDYNYFIDIWEDFKSKDNHFEGLSYIVNPCCRSYQWIWSHSAKGCSGKQGHHSQIFIGF